MSQDNVTYHAGLVSPEDRARLLGQTPRTIWLTGLSGAGKSTLATHLEKALIDQGRACMVLDGDNVRHGLCRDLGFSAADRAENIRRVAEVARLLNAAGIIVITAFISPFRADREIARAIVGPERFFEVHVATPIEVCEERDPKGLYLKARCGQLPDFTGIDSPYEPPECPDMTLSCDVRTVNALTDELLQGVLAISGKPYLSQGVICNE